MELKLNEENIKSTLTNDYIGRNKYLTSFLTILNDCEENEIIALDGEWGAGKTWFVKSLEYLINSDINEEIKVVDKDLLESVKNNYMTFYYNAWENDDAKSAMLSLIYKLTNDSFLKKVDEKDKVSPMPRILNALIKYATAGAVDIKQDLFGEQWNNKKITDEIITSEEIKNTFREMIDNLLIENRNRILIIIDEIDRCKPTFAIDLLENIKHFYDDDRIVFLVVTNNKELAASVCKVYGEKYNGGLYLDRFFDFCLELPNNYIEKYIKEISDDGYEEGDYWYAYKEIAMEYKFTMREYNRYFSCIKRIYGRLISGYNYITFFANYVVIPLAIALKIKNKEQYYDFVSGKQNDIITNLVKNNNWFNNLGGDLLNQKDGKLLKTIEQETTDTKLKIQMKNNEIIKFVEELYNNLLENESTTDDRWMYRSTLSRVIDIISLF